ncbi:M48 family metalloprotease [Methanoculleus sp. Wushi-C6]|uniref:M48 family metalloprotease n=1 Tax=Methanoculleus caldifontis TaxID=2651577 RepID=A0ABU3X4K9_9EURY|nr:M48 family metalloprotease [Methanoculleus sp. Wushi-C6]
MQCRFTLSIRAYPALNSIRYRRTFYDRHLAGANDDTLRFVLLHEEGHIRKGSSLTSALPGLPVLPCLALLHPPIESLPAIGLSLLQTTGGLLAAKLGLIVLLVLTAFVAYRAYYRRMCDEEFIADRYAAEAMRRCYRIRDPAALLQNLFAGLPGRAPSSCRRKTGGLLQAIRGLSGSEPDYHPPIAERVRKVRDGNSVEGRTATCFSR